jgi:hypothetical protein
MLLLVLLVTFVNGFSNTTAIPEYFIGSFSASVTLFPAKCSSCTKLTTRASLVISSNSIMVNYESYRKSDLCVIPTTMLLFSVNSVIGNTTNGILSIDRKDVGIHCLVLSKNDNIVQLSLDLVSSQCPTNNDVVCMRNDHGNVISRTILVETRDQQFWLVFAICLMFAVPTITIPAIIIICLFVMRITRSDPPTYSRLEEDLQESQL